MFTGELYPYQLEAVDRILDRRKLLLAYSMGLGKTPITLAATETLLGERKVDGVLIIVPASLKYQWSDALRKFTDVEWFMGTKGRPHIERKHCVVIDGNKKEREFLWELAEDLCSSYTICSYAAFRLDQPPIWTYGAVVLDEATAIKSFRSNISKQLKQFKPPFRIALSGAPVENRPEEAFSIMQWVDESVFGRWDLFDKSFIARNKFGGVERYKNLDLMHAKLSTAMVRKSRKDPDVAPYLPDVVETNVPVELDAVTRRCYRRLEKNLYKALNAMKEAGGSFDLAEYYAGGPALSSSLRGVVMARMQILHMLLDHPLLVSQSAKLSETTGNSGSAYAYDLMRTPGFVLPETSPKLDALDSLVDRMLAEDGKIIIFTQYRMMLELISMRLAAKARYVTYHGGMDSKAKAATVDIFRSQPECRFFVSTDAGGYGLDLPEANFLINYDLPYSAGKKGQRDTRHVRASSRHEKVYVANLVCSDTVEERVSSILAMRGRVADAIVDGSGESVISNDISSLTEQVRPGALSL